MQKIKLGRTGLNVSRIALGGYPFGGVNKANDWDPWSEAGKRTAIGTVNHAIDRGINYVDTAPGYGEGNSERIIGEVMKTRRDEVVLATKVRWEKMSKQAVIDSVHESLSRLQTNHLDIVQFHGGMFTAADYAQVVDGGPLEALVDLKAQGKIGFIGLTAEEPWTAIQFLAHPEIDVYQLAYNFIYQHAAKHMLIDAHAANVGVVTMRTMTSGILQRAAKYLAPEWQSARDLFQVSLEFVLSDSRVHSAIVGMRWPSEVDLNVDLVENFKPQFDFAELPRMTAHVYQAEDAE